MRSRCQSNEALRVYFAGGVLNDNGIVCVVRSHGLGSYGEMLFGRTGKGGIEIQVSDEDAERSEEIVGVLSQRV